MSAAAVTGADLLKQPDAVDASSDGFYPAAPSQPLEFDFTQQSGALQPDRIVFGRTPFLSRMALARSSRLPQS